MSFRLVSWNADRLMRRVPRRILEDYGDVLGPQLQDEIQKEQFKWPNETRRRNGRLVSSPRDIVDTSEFLNSQTAPQVSEEGATVTMRIGWTAPYAADIFNGVVGDDFVNYAGTLQTTDPAKARDWIKPALDAQPFDRYFIQRWKELDRG
jgi:hypothetical protein